MDADYIHRGIEKAFKRNAGEQLPRHWEMIEATTMHLMAKKVFELTLKALAIIDKDRDEDSCVLRRDAITHGVIASAYNGVLQKIKNDVPACDIVDEKPPANILSILGNLSSKSETKRKRIVRRQPPVSSGTSYEKLSDQEVLDVLAAIYGFEINADKLDFGDQVFPLSRIRLKVNDNSPKSMKRYRPVVFMKEKEKKEKYCIGLVVLDDKGRIKKAYDFGKFKSNGQRGTDINVRLDECRNHLNTRIEDDFAAAMHEWAQENRGDSGGLEESEEEAPSDNRKNRSKEEQEESEQEEEKSERRSKRNKKKSDSAKKSKKTSKETDEESSPEDYVKADREISQSVETVKSGKKSGSRTPRSRDYSPGKSGDELRKGLSDVGEKMDLDVRVPEQDESEDPDDDMGNGEEGVDINEYGDM